MKGKQVVLAYSENLDGGKMIFHGACIICAGLFNLMMAGNKTEKYKILQMTTLRT